MPVFFGEDGNQVFMFKRRYATTGEDVQGF